MKDTKALKNKPGLLLHSCCGPCSTAVIERLIEEYEVTVFFYNPNVTDFEEYSRRKSAQLQFLKNYKHNAHDFDSVNFIEGSYDKETFYKSIEGLELEDEGGKRCIECFKIRLAETSKKALELGMEFFGTTLSVSPRKKYEQIQQIGKNLEGETGLKFLDMDFKKKAGFQRSVEMSKQYELYRQNYCGCEFSKRQ